MNRIKKVRTLHEKLCIINEVENNPGEKRVDIARRLNLSPSTLNSIYCKKNDVRQQISKCGESSSTIRKYGREPNFEELETVLIDWYRQSRLAKIPIDGNIIRKKALSIAEILDIKDFKASNGWISRFKNRYGIDYKREKVNTELSKTWSNQLAEYVKKYEPKDIYIAGETGLFYDCVPNNTLEFYKRDCHGGEMSENRLTVLLCVNSDNSDPRQPIVIGESSCPISLTNTINFPVKYYTNKKSWMTSDIFIDFLRNLEAEMASQRRKILLFVDHTSAPFCNTSFFKYINVIVKPDTDLNGRQPFNIEIIKCFKANYRVQLIQKLIFLMDSTNNLNSERLKIDFVTYLEFIKTAWVCITDSIVTRCFQKYGFSSTDTYADKDSVWSYISEDQWNKIENDLDVDFETYVDVDINLVTSGIDTIEELCEQRMDFIKEANSGSEEEETNISHSEAYHLFQKIKNYVRSHDLNDEEKLTVCKMEKIISKIEND